MQWQIKKNKKNQALSTSKAITGISGKVPVLTPFYIKDVGFRKHIRCINAA